MADPLSPTKPMPQRISMSSHAFLLTISLSLASFSLYFLSFRDTTFWFFLSNAIIFLIAAADSETSSSSSSNHKADLYEEYLKTIRSRNTYAISHYELKPQEKKLDPESRNEDSKETESSLPDPVSESPTTMEEKKDSGIGSFQEVKEKAIVAVDDNEKEQRVVSRSDDEDGGPVLDGGDFSALSNEELNKRVEDFIRKFNREIWLQEMRERKRLKQI